MSSDTTAFLFAASKQIVKYSGIFCFLIGIIGGLFNVLVFLTLRTFRQSPCAFYLTVMSIANINQIIIVILADFLNASYSIDWTQTSIVYCKMRPLLFHVIRITSSACLCLATIDQYLCTSPRPYWRQWSNIKLSHRLIAIFISVWIIAEIPCLVYYNHTISSSTGKVSCTITNVAFIKFNEYFSELIAWHILPILITVFFAILAYYNVRQIAHQTVPIIRHQLDKQLTKMLFLQVIFNCIFVVPYLVMVLILRYGNIVIRNDISSASLVFVYNLFVCLYYLYFAVSLTIIDCSLHIFFVLFSDSFLSLYLCIGKISTTICLCSLESSFKSMETTTNNYSY